MNHTVCMDPERFSDTDPSQILVTSYGTDAFVQAAARLGARFDEGASVRILFLGGTRDEHQHALTTLTTRTVENVHQFALSALVKERRMQTQSSIRKAFDAAAEEGALLFFDEVDMLFDWRHPDALGGEAEPSSIEYFFQRVAAYDGVVVLALEVPEHVEAARPYGLHLIVDFG